MTEYPILVEMWDDKHPADLAICEKCHVEFTWDAGEGDPYDLCIKHKVCGGQIVFKYDSGDKCDNCGKLDYRMPLSVGRGRYCSRRCALQVEWAKQIGATNA